MKKILFQGDSVTDAGRTCRKEENLGDGYPAVIAGMLKENGEKAVVINRGVSGNRAIDLTERWERDCIELKPDIVTILIGINDCWRKYDSNDETTVEDFAARLDAILKETREKTDAEIILMDPFVLPNPEERKEWRVTLDPEIHAVRLLARKYNAVYLPLDGVMNRAAIKYGYTAVSEDGVHPTDFGHQIIAQAWMEEYKKL